MEWAPVYHIKGWGKFNWNYGDFCTGADTAGTSPDIGVASDQQTASEGPGENGWKATSLGDVVLLSGH